MGEIFHALEALNRTMNLGLRADQILVAEAGFKSALARQGNPDPTLPTDAVALAEGYELVATLRPRAEKLSMDRLSALAHEEVAAPRTRLDAAAITQLSQKLNVNMANIGNVTEVAKGGIKGSRIAKGPAAPGVG